MGQLPRTSVRPPVRPSVPRRGYDDNSRPPRGHDGLIDRIVPIVGLGLRAERQVQDADVVSLAIRNNPIQPGYDIRVAAAAGAVEGANDHEVGLRCYARVAE